MIALSKRGFVAGMAAAAACTVGAVTARSTTSSAGPPLWRAAAGGRTAYLFGHIPLPAGVEWNSPAVAAAFAASSELWVENPEFARDEIEALQGELAGKARIPVEALLSGEELARMRRALETSGNDPASLDGVAADDAYQVLSSIAYDAAKADYGNLPDRALREQARERGLSIKTEWANLREVANFIPLAPDPIQAQLISMGIDELAGVAQAIERVPAWQHGDIAPFEQLATAFSERYPELYALLSAQRNSRFAERLAAAMTAGGDPFVCVGMLHLVGPASIVSALAERGIASQRV